MRTVLYLMLAAAVPAAAGIAQTREQTVTVQAPKVTLEQWSTSVTRKLDRRLRYLSPMFRSPDPSGIVAVGFECDGNGKPAQLELMRDSQDRRLNAAAMRAVRGIDTLHPMPANLKASQKFRANILFARNERELADQMRQVKREAAEARATARAGDQPVIALMIGSHVVN